METELLAQAVEEISVVASGMQRKKPRKVPRPDHVKSSGKPRERPVDAVSRPPGEDEATVIDMAGYRQAVGVLSASSRKGAIRVEEDGG